MYRSADKSLARPGRNQARKPVKGRAWFQHRDASCHQDFFLTREGAEGNSRHSDRNISLFPSWSGWGLISTPVQEDEWASKPLWTGAGNFAFTGIGSSDHPACSKSLPNALSRPTVYACKGFKQISVVGIVTQELVGQPSSFGSNPGRGRRFYFLQVFWPPVGPTQPPVHWEAWALLSGNEANGA